MIFITVLIGAIIFLVVHYIKSQKGKDDKTPPGPWGLPIVGHLYQLGDPWEVKFLEWKKKYGPVISIRFGSVPVVVLTDSKMIREAFSSNSISSRPDLESFKNISDGFKGIFAANGQDAREQRQFVISTMKQFGYGKSLMEDAIQEDLTLVIEQLQKDAESSLASGKPLSLDNRFNVGPLNSIWKLIMQNGITREHGDVDSFVKIIQTEVQSDGILSELANYIPILTKIFPSITKQSLKKFADFKKLHHFIQTQIDAHAKTRIPDQPRDLTDAYLDKIAHTKDPKSSFHKDRGFQAVALSDLSIPALDDINIALQWVFLHLIRNEEVQEKVYQEIISVTSNSRKVVLSDRPNLPLTDALIHESMRMTPNTPNGLMHLCTEDIMIGGYLIKKGTAVMGIYHAVQCDPDIWPDPLTFKPERFLNENGKMKGHFVDYMPFGIGNRACIGEQFGMSSMVLYLANLIQLFKFERWGGTSMLPTLKGISGIGAMPTPYVLKVTPRSQT